MRRLGIISILLIILGSTAAYANDTDRYQKMLEQASDYIARKDYDRAFVAYDLAVMLEPELADAYISSGTLYFCLNMFDKAAETAGRLLLTDPDSTGGFVLQCLSELGLKEQEQQYDSGVFDELEKITEETLSEDPLSVNGWVFQCIVDLGNDDISKLDRDIMYAEVCGADLRPYFEFIGNAYQNAGEEEKAAGYLEIVDRLFKNDIFKKTEFIKETLYSTADSEEEAETEVTESEAEPDKTERNVNKAEYTDGVYEGTGTGNGGEMKVTVTVKDGKITDVVLKEGHNETPGIYDLAVEQVIPAIIETQSIDVYSASGASMSSTGIKEAVADALNKAGILSEFQKEKSRTEASVSKNESDGKSTVQSDSTEKKNHSYTNNNLSETLTPGERNALQRAKDYINIMPFSYSGLIDQLEYEGFLHNEAVYGADHCGADWKQQAYLKAKQYLEIMTFSYSGLVDQLLYEGFTQEQATYGVERAY